jgi:phospholipase/lecithinase/hemolysin
MPLLNVSWCPLDDVLEIADSITFTTNDAASRRFLFDLSELEGLVSNPIPVLGRIAVDYAHTPAGGGSGISAFSSSLGRLARDLIDDALADLGAIAFLPAPLLEQLAVNFVSDLVDEILPNLGVIALSPLPVLVTLTNMALNGALSEVAAIVPTFAALFDYNNLTISPANAGRAYNQIVVFGDSLSDTGNLFTALNGAFPPPPYFQGRLSNGPIWIDDLAPTLGLSANQVLNFSFAGATTGRTNTAAATIGQPLPIPLPGLLDEVDQFTSALGCGGANPDALYVVWAGANDYLTLPQTIDGAIAAILDGVENVITAVTDLAEVGARTIAVGNLPNLGRTPLVNQQGAVVEAAAFSISFNLALEYTLAQLEENLGVDIVQIDTFSLGEAIAQRPSEFGFTNITDPLLTQLLSPTPPVNPQGFFYWDDFHPTATTHQLIADAFARSLSTPVPSRVINTSLGLVSAGINSSGFQSVLSNLLSEVQTALPRYLPLAQP